MHKLILSAVISSFLAINLWSQRIGSLGPTGITDGETYALVVGITKYKDDRIKKLEYAVNDASEFVEYLTSPAGGSVPPENIKFLKDEEATVSNIYVAMQWLQNKARKDDLVYFYFAGHGDVESGLYKLGFLLAHDTPYQNYINNAVRIEDVNIMANTLSVRKEAKVILITDACHSGKLAGSDNRGSMLVGDQLTKVEDLEVRLVSCEADQLAQENAAWGNGRGAFSYYLIHGLRGHADAEDRQGIKDGIITLREMKRYLEDNVTPDVNDLFQTEQIPVATGKTNAKLAIVDEETFKPLPKPGPNLSVTSGSGRSIELKKTNLDFFFENVTTSDMETVVDYTYWSTESPRDFALQCLRELSYHIPGDETSEEWMDRYDSDANFRRMVNENLAAELHNIVQDAITRYLNTDSEELAKRQYFSSREFSYKTYPHIIQVAMKLLDKSHPLYKILEFKYHYFNGMICRLEIPTTLNRDSLIALAFSEQDKALALEPQAAYVINELGVLNRISGNLEAAKSLYLQATELAPTWAVPWSNLSGLYDDFGELEKGIEAGKKATSIAGEFPNAYLNLGVNYLKGNNLLLAEDKFWKALYLDSRHFLPFERLAQVYYAETQYEHAEEFFYEADLRKKGFFPMGMPDMDADGVSDVLDLSHNMCDYDTAAFGPNDVMAHFVYAMYVFEAGDKVTGERFLRKTLDIEPNNPLAYRYLAKLKQEVGDKLEAEYFYEKAEQQFLKRHDFTAYFDSLLPTQVYLECDIANQYSGYYFEFEEILYLKGRFYEEWQHFVEAEATYQRLIERDPTAMNGYYMIWTMYEKRRMYDFQEATIRSFAEVDSDQGVRELANFYRNRTEDFPDNFRYANKAGNLFYEYAVSESPTSFNDTIKTEAWSYPDAFFSQKDDNLHYFTGTEELPGLDEYMYMSQPITEPRREGVEFLVKASELTNDSLMRSDCRAKAGDLYDLAGSTKGAAEQYEMAVAFDPENASYRKFLIFYQDDVYYFEKALANLDTLNERGQIGYGEVPLYFSYLIRSAQFEKADRLIQRALKDVGELHEIMTEDVALRFLLAGEYVKAKSGYMRLLESTPNHAGYAFTLHRICRALNQEAEAASYLAKAKMLGFDYAFVLQYDETQRP